MRRILFLIPSLEYSGAAKQLTILAGRLPRERFQAHVGVLRRTGPFAKLLSSAGVAIDVLGEDRIADPGRLWRLWRCWQAYHPDVIHVWGLAALRAVFLAGGWRGTPIVVSHPCPPHEDERQGWAGSLLDPWLLRRANRVAVQGAAQAECSRRRGVVEQRLVVVPPGVDSAAPVGAEAGIGDGLPVPPAARWIACVGPLVRNKGYQEALWAFDILKYLYNDLHLLLIGEGPDRRRLEQFARNIQVLDRVHFLGARSDAAGLLARSDLVWVPSRTDAGLNVALESMALSRPVLAWRLPAQAEIIVDGETGFLAPVGDKAVLARHTRTLLDDDDLRLRMGEAGRQRATQQFSAAEMVHRFGRLYEMVSGES